MKDERFKKYVISDEHLDVDWSHQRIKINERIDAVPAKTRLAWHWAAAAVTIAAIAAFTWFGVHQLSVPDDEDIAMAELEEEVDEIIDGRLPQSLYVLNGWSDAILTDWESQYTPVDQFEQILVPEENGTEKEAL